MIITIIILAAGFPFLLLMRPAKTRQAAVRPVESNGAFDLALTSEAHEHA